MRPIGHMPFGKARNTLAFKISFAYSIVIIVTVTLSCVILNRISSNAAQNKVNEASLKTITSVKTNVDLLLQNIDNYSKMMLSDNDLQNLLRKGNVYSNLQLQAKVTRHFYGLFEAEPLIDSVYIFDHANNCFSVGQHGSPTFIKSRVQDAPWYEDAVKNQGKYILSLNGGGVFSYTENGNFVSFIRLVRDLDNTRSLGIMVINLQGDVFVEAFKNITYESDLQVVILDQHDQIIVPATTENNNVHVFKKVLSGNKDLRQKLHQSGSNYMIEESDSQKYLISYVSEDASSWKYISIMPYDILRTQNRSLVLITFVLLFIDGIIFFVSSFLISRNIINPVHQILQSMKSADYGKFHEIGTKPNSYEFRQLYDGYNKMIGQINQLLAKTIQEQKIIRKSELNMLQAQIKPHFLYNTLDSISSLALSGCNEEVCFLVESLGNYYRNSVSKGKEVITVGQELDIVRNYLNIQKVRYPELFEAQYQVDDSCLTYPIIKLVLQPLVENALYHGIRGKGAPGIIRISVRDMADHIVLSVEDDGIGISKDEISMILEKEKAEKIESFGLSGTMERVRIYYGEENCVKIESEPGVGTKITLIILKRKYMEWSGSKF
jgi:two-component system, sensor histidine kinase YesM